MIKLHLPYPSVWGLYDGWGAKRRLSPTYTKWRTDASFFIKVEADTRQELLPLAIRRASCSKCQTAASDGRWFVRRSNK